MVEVDRLIAQERTEALSRVQEQVNAHRRRTPPYRVGDWVFVRRPKLEKLDTRWIGPYRVESRVGENSYEVKVPGDGLLAVHATQVKVCHWLPEGEPLYAMTIPPTREAGPEESEE